MEQEKNIEDVFCPDQYELKEIEKGYWKTKIVDASLDVIECSFIADGVVTLDTKDYTCLELTYHNLRMLMELIANVEVLDKSINYDE